MRIAIGADHAGFDMKNELVVALQAAGHEVRQRLNKILATEARFSRT